MITPEMQQEFNEVIDFHGCYCLDIAMGYRVSKALVREMGEDMKNMKEVFGYISAPTCAMDAIQKLTGCTLGKRNLILNDVGKTAFALQNVATGKAVRAYVHYWDQFDHSELRQKRKEANDPVHGTPEKKAEFKKLMDAKMNVILTAPEEELFRLQQVSLPKPPKSSKYVAVECPQCGEFVREESLVDNNGGKACQECAS